MSTEVMSLQEKIRAELDNVRNTVAAPSSNAISCAGKVFTLPDGRADQGPLSCVILDHRNFNRYYSQPYDQNNPVPPQCFAISKDITGMAPHAEAAEPQCEDCATCPLNQWGSAPTGKGKACRNTVKLAIAPIDADGDTEPMTLVVSPTGLKSWAAFVNSLETIGKLPIQAVAEVSFDPKSAYPSLRFAVREFHDDLETFWAIREKAQAILDAPPASGS